MRDEDGFAAANGRRLRHAARLLTGAEGRAEDLVQTAPARTYLRWDRIRADDPTAYVRRVMYTAHAEWWRRKWRHEYATGDLPDGPVTGAIVCTYGFLVDRPSSGRLSGTARLTAAACQQRHGHQGLRDARGCLRQLEERATR